MAADGSSRTPRSSWSTRSVPPTTDAAPTVAGMATTRPTAASVRSDLLDEQAALDAIVVGADRRPVGAADGEPRLVGRRPDRSPRVLRRDRVVGDRRRGPLPGLARRPRPRLRPGCGPRRDRRPHARLVPGDVTRRTARRLEDQPPAARRRGRDPRRRHPSRLVRPVDGRQVVPHRTPDGVLGARPARRRRGRGRAANRPIGSSTSPSSDSSPATGPTSTAASTLPATAVRVELDGAVGWDLDVRT